MTDQSRLTTALVLSLLLHAMALSLLPLLRRLPLQFPTPPLVDVDLVQLPKAKPAPPPPAPAAEPAPDAPAPQAPAIPIPKQQIVSPPDAGEEKEPENARFLSDRNTSVKEETVRRGEPEAGDPDAKAAQPPREVAKAARAQPAASQPRSTGQTQVASLPRLDRLLPPTGDLIREGIVQPRASQADTAPQQEAPVHRSDLLRHGDPWRIGTLRGGTLDFLPAVREGDITLLNTKAEQFAPFVRRVAVRVFENFRILLRRNLDTRRADSAEEFATIEAVMDKQGRLLSISAKDRSVNAALGTDRNLQAATREGFFDRNPPPGAEASDGNIHFLFDARVALLIDPGRGLVGYRALFQAGLL